MKKKTEKELITDCHGKTEINFTIILVFRNRVSSVERFEYNAWRVSSVERLKNTREISML